MNASRYIVISGAMIALCVGQAWALTPLPQQCTNSGDTAEGREIVTAWHQENGFVTYSTLDKAEREYFYLEHCSSGKILRSKSRPYRAGPIGPRDASEISNTLYEALRSEQAYTLSELQALLRVQGVRTKRYTSTAESCACKVHYSAERGSKTPYKKDAK